MLDEINREIARKILSNKQNAEKYLFKLKQVKEIILEIRRLLKGKNKGKKVLDMTTDEIWEKVVTTWDYKYSLPIIRKMFRRTEKYKIGIEAEENYRKKKAEWKEEGLGLLEWPCRQGSLDSYIDNINRNKKLTAKERDKKVMRAIKKYARLKELNTIRHNYIETLIFENNNNFLPTLSHWKGIDFYMNGESYDLKISSSPTTQFKKDFGSDWRQIAIENPLKVSEYLYKYQSGGNRFGYNRRLFVVYLDKPENVIMKSIGNIIKNAEFKNPLKVEFTYNHEDDRGEQKYETKCFIIFLYNII